MTTADTRMHSVREICGVPVKCEFEKVVDEVEVLDKIHPIFEP